MSMVHYALVLSGNVQGVSFRIQTKQKAEQLGITGWVRNKPNGTVMIEAHGDERHMRIFLAWCRKGPIGATVDRVVLRHLPDQHPPREFVIF